MHSAAGEEFTDGICSVNFPGLDRPKLQQWLYEKRNIRLRATSPTRLRLSTHIYHSFAELDRFLEAFRDFHRIAA